MGVDETAFLAANAQHPTLFVPALSTCTRADRPGDPGGVRGPGQCPAGTGAVHPPSGTGPPDWAGTAAVNGLPDGAQHGDGQGDVGRPGVLAEHVQQLVAGLVTQVSDVGGARLGHPQPEHAEQADQRVVVGARSACSEQRGELQRVQHRPLLSFPGHLRPGDSRGRVSREDAVDDGVLVEGGRGAEPAGHRRGRYPRPSRCRTYSSSSPRVTRSTPRSLLWHQPRNALRSWM